MVRLGQVRWGYKNWPKVRWGYKCYCHVSMLDCKKREIWEWAEERVVTVEMSILIDSRLQASFQQIAFKWDKK